jgi:hypothetical protein|tara:strand:+ start:60 stop:449 length:390 start_codon:yes stop_codon:yes gene_type:complete
MPEQYPSDHPINVAERVIDDTYRRIRRERQHKLINSALRRLGILSAIGSGWLTIDGDSNLVFGPIPEDRVTPLILTLDDLVKAVESSSDGSPSSGRDHGQLPGTQKGRGTDVDPLIANDRHGRHLGGTR